MKADAWSLVLTGLSLTCITSAALFALVAVNPKEAAYGTAPLFYAAAAAVMAVVFNRASAWIAQRGRLDAVVEGNGHESPEAVDRTTRAQQS
jgi:hypothetical protein